MFVVNSTCLFIIFYVLNNDWDSEELVMSKTNKTPSLENSESNEEDKQANNSNKVRKLV